MTGRFVKLPHAVIDHADLDAHELLVYIVLHRYRDPQTGECFPGLQTIADAARISRDSVRRATKRLEGKGIIGVERVKAVGAKTNESNKYTVGNLSGDPVAYLGHSVKGDRIPRRNLSNEARKKLSKAARKGSSSQPSPSSSSEALPSNQPSQGSSSELLRSGSQLLGVVAPSHGKKTQYKKTHKEDITPTFKESGRDLISYEKTDDLLATEEQALYIKDLSIHLSYEAGYQTMPTEEHLNRWRKLNRNEADNLIKSYKQELGRPDDRLYPQYGTPEYEALTQAGKEFAETGGMPNSVWDYSSAAQFMKENTA